MKNKSSNVYMEKSILNIISNIESVNPPEDLLSKIDAKINSQKQFEIPISWVKNIAAAFILMLLTEYIIIDNKVNSNDLSIENRELIHLPNNLLYE